LKTHIKFRADKGYNVDTAANGENAITIVKEEQYDLVFIAEMI